jgi:small-conductance mechanosensitive channel
MKSQSRFLEFKYLISIALLAIFFSATFFSAFTYVGTAQTNGSPHINFHQFLDDYDNRTGEFTSYQPDDVVVIEDEIVQVELVETDLAQTYIWLESVGVSPYREHLVLIGDKFDDFRTGDKITVELTIKSNATGEYYDYTYKDIKHVVKVEREGEIHGIELFGYSFDLPEILDSDLGRFLIILSIWIIVAITVLFILDPLVHSLVKKTTTNLDDMILGIIRKPIIILIILYGVVNSLEALNLPDDIMSYFYTIYGIGFIGMMVWIALKIFRGILIELGRKWAKKSHSRLEHVLIPVLEKIGTILIIVFGLMYILAYFGIDLTLFVAGMGVMGLIIAFAAQDTLSNFFGGIFLIVEPNFKEGDTVLLKDNYYEVKKIGMRTTQLYDIFKHIIVVVPNDMLANEMLTNLTEPDRRIKDKVTVGVAYGVDTHKVEKILLEIGNSNKDVITKDPERKPFVRFHSFGDSALDFGLYFWVNDLDNRYRVKHELNHEIHKRFEKENIEIPFPQRVITMKKE